MSKNISIKNDKNNIILVGFMGAGKSFIGQILSRKLNMSFIDTDQLIAQKTEMSIASIFEKHGEQHFRQLESSLILSLKDTENSVVATGGGMPIFNHNMNMLSKLGHTFYLKVGIDALVERISRSNERPLINTFQSKKEIRNYISNTLVKRAPHYEKADNTIVASRPSDKIVNRIIALHNYFL